MLIALLLIAEVVQAQPAPPRQTGGAVSYRDYPREALIAQAQGNVRVTLSIDQRGAVSECRVIESSSDASLDSATCAIIRERFTFEPARDAEGQAVAATVNRRIVWRLPADDGIQSFAAAPVPFMPSRVAVETLGTNTGRIFCRRSVEGQPPEAMMSRECFPGSTDSERPQYPQTRMTNVSTLIVDGGASDHRRGPGALIGQDRVRFVVNPLGVVTSCESALRRDADDRDQASARLRCEQLTAGGRPVFTPSQSQAIRRGEIVGTVNLQVR